MAVNITVVVKEKRRRHTSRLHWTLGPVAVQPLAVRSEQEILMLQLTDSQKCPLSIAAVDAKGFPTDIQPNSVVWTSSDEAVATVTMPDPSDPKAVVVVAEAPGSAQINVTADADLGAGVTSITGTLDVTVVAGEAAAITVSTGTPVAQ